VPASRRKTFDATRPADAVFLREGRDKSVSNRHPWIFSGAVQSVGAAIEDGAIAPIRASGGQILGFGFVNRSSQIVVRMLSFGSLAVGPEEIRERITVAARARAATGARRCVYAESDGLPGLIVDRYGAFAVIQISTLGMERLRAVLVQAVAETLGAEGVFERSEGEGRRKEGLKPRIGLAAGQEPPDLIQIVEDGVGGPVRLLVDVRKGHKTGAYLDQGRNRNRVASYASGGEVLNVFSYTGGFALHAATAGASRVLNLDASADALALSRRNAELCGFSGIIDHRRGDAFDVLRELRDQGARYALVIVDPPKFVDSARHLKAGTRGYKDINRVALELVRPGGHLATFSCSGLVSADLFQKIVWSATRDSNRRAAIVERLSQPEDHPVLLDFPESEYLKGLVLRVY
jgi:23S rRNA (cytosine1962-C5)-methyltransferase